MTPDQIDALATRLFGAIEAGDVEACADCYSADVVVWHNHDRRQQRKDRNLAVLQWLIENVKDRRYEEIQRVVVADGFVQQHVLRGTAPNGEHLDLPAMLRVWCLDGYITRIDEYLDSQQLVVLRQ
jgi:ketosteroid isomerase-like protein